MRASARLAHGNFPIGLIGESADLTYLTSISVPARRRSPILRQAGTSFSARSSKPRTDGHRRNGGAGAAGRRGSCLARGSGCNPSCSRDQRRYDGWNGYCILHTAASRVGALDMGFVPGRGGLGAQDMAVPYGLDIIFLLGADEIDVAPGAFVVYIGTHGDQGARRADVILPGAAYPGEIGGLRQYRRSRANCQPRLVPAR